MKKIELFSGKRKAFTAVILATMVVFTGCGSNSKESLEESQSTVESTVVNETETIESENKETEITESETENTDNEVSETDSVSEEVLENGASDMLNTIWDNFSEQFAVYGGGASNAVEGHAGGVDLADTDTLQYTMLIPNESISEVEEAACLVHMMNANTFTSGVVKVSNDQEAFMETLKSAILNKQWMCGFPDKFVVLTSGDYVLYAFGATDNVNNFSELAQNNLEGVEVVVDQLLE